MIFHTPSLGAFHYFCLDHHFSIGSSFQPQLILGQMKLLGVDPRHGHACPPPLLGQSLAHHRPLVNACFTDKQLLRTHSDLFLSPESFPKLPTAQKSSPTLWPSSEGRSMP